MVGNYIVNTQENNNHEHMYALGTGEHYRPCDTQTSIVII